VFSETPRASIKERRIYSPNCREEFFSETGLPVYGVLGNSLLRPSIDIRSEDAFVEGRGLCPIRNL
jgi:hypothetical protein